MPEDWDDIAALAADLREQLAFFRDIGITDIGGSRRESSHLSLESVSETNRQTEATREAPATDPTGPRPTQPGAPQLNLFGEVVSPVASAMDLRPTISTSETSGSIDLPGDRSLEDIRADIGECTRCRLHEHRTNIVFGEGNPAAKLAFVGEGPGADEDRTGRPFVGKAGKLLDKIIEAMGMNREDLYIANVVKCRPPDNRAPERDEAATCGPFLFRQLEFIRPKVIVTLGAPALQCLTGSNLGITKARGHWQEWRGIKVMPTFHPAYLLRSPDKKKETWEDMKKVRDYIISGEFCS